MIDVVIAKNTLFNFDYFHLTSQFLSTITSNEHSLHPSFPLRIPSASRGSLSGSLAAANTLAVTALVQ